MYEGLHFNFKMASRSFAYVDSPSRPVKDSAPWRPSAVCAGGGGAGGQTSVLRKRLETTWLSRVSVATLCGVGRQRGVTREVPGWLSLVGAEARGDLPPVRCGEPPAPAGTFPTLRGPDKPRAALSRCRRARGRPCTESRLRLRCCRYFTVIYVLIFMYICENCKNSHRLFSNICARCVCSSELCVTCCLHVGGQAV